jgi:hypothetical protein
MTQVLGVVTLVNDLTKIWVVLNHYIFSVGRIVEYTDVSPEADPSHLFPSEIMAK